MSAKTIYMAGEYGDGVAVTAQFRNGSGLTASGKFAHAEGMDTSATGDYSHSEGVSSVAKDAYSYVFNGDPTVKVESNGKGTFTINANGGADGFFIGAKSLGDLISSGGGAQGILSSDNMFTGSNRFKGFTRLFKTELADDVTLSNIAATVNLSAGDVKVATANLTSEDETAASTRFVHALIREYFKAILGSGVVTK